MVDRITSSIAREAILAAIKDQSQAAKSIQDDAARMFESAVRSGSAGAGPGAAEGPTGASSITNQIGDGLRAVDREVRAASPEQLAKDLISGEITDFHEVAVRVNRARISFEYALEIRNKLIDAYRETMRMTV